ncbi:hypothetical protein [Ferrovibrio sp.]|uniref:LexA family protein n=1 Tax=Ferrovibrio sp. TaxID=1917215 RepID=UPI0035B4E5F4
MNISIESLQSILRCHVTAAELHQIIEKCRAEAARANPARYNLSPGQKRVLDFIVEYHGQRVFVPSYQEIVDKLGLRSKGNVCRYIEALVERGHLRRIPGRSRSLTVI